MNDAALLIIAVWIFGIFAIGYGTAKLIDDRVWSMICCFIIAAPFGALMGPSQVVARLLEYAFGRNAHPVWIARLGILACMVGLLALGPGIVLLSLLAVITFGGGNGIMTIARGTVPLTLLGSINLGMHLGLIARPVLIAQAVAPMVCAYILVQLGPNWLIWIMAGILGVGALVAFTKLRTFDPSAT